MSTCTAPKNCYSSPSDGVSVIPFVEAKNNTLAELQQYLWDVKRIILDAMQGEQNLTDIVFQYAGKIHENPWHYRSGFLIVLPEQTGESALLGRVLSKIVKEKTTRKKKKKKESEEQDDELDRGRTGGLRGWQLRAIQNASDVCTTLHSPYTVQQTKVHTVHGSYNIQNDSVMLSWTQNGIYSCDKTGKKGKKKVKKAMKKKKFQK